MGYPDYSVLMSVYTKEKPEYLIMSIESILNQTVAPWEFVIVRDGPITEELNAVLQAYKSKYPELFRYVLLEKNMGLGPALAAGLLQCSCEYIARMDSDDISHPKRCETILDVLINDKALDIVGCFENEFLASPSEIVSVHRVPETHEEIAHFMKRRCSILHPTVIYKKSAVLACGNYQNVPLLEDYDLFARMVQNGAKCFNVQSALYYLRINDSFYKRRGGRNYLKSQLKFKRDRFKRGFISLEDFVISAGIQAVVCLMPNRLRAFVYLKLLRS